MWNPPGRGYDTVYRMQALPESIVIHNLDPSGRVSFVVAGWRFPKYIPTERGVTRGSGWEPS